MPGYLTVPGGSQLWNFFVALIYQWPRISAPSPDLASELTGPVPAQPALPRSKVAGPPAAWAGASDRLSCPPSPRRPAGPVLPGGLGGRFRPRAASALRGALRRGPSPCHDAPAALRRADGPRAGGAALAGSPPAARGPPAGGPSGPETPGRRGRRQHHRGPACQPECTRRARARIRRISLPRRLLPGIPHSAASVCAG